MVIHPTKNSLYLLDYPQSLSGINTPQSWTLLTPNFLSLIPVIIFNQFPILGSLKEKLQVRLICCQWTCHKPASFTGVSRKLPETSPRHWTLLSRWQFTVTCQTGICSSQTLLFQLVLVAKCHSSTALSLSLSWN